MQANEAEASPMKAIIEEISKLRGDLKESLEVYGARLDQELAGIAELMEKVSLAPKIPTGKLRDMREIITLLRHADIKSKKGRRKDIKKIDSIIGDLAMLTEKW
ncbi:hypothetical protein BH09VER1_BH09VER1_01180 [soil metagenome]